MKRYFVCPSNDSLNFTNLSSSFQLFINCLAPNTAGDGTGCDNMTAVIVQFKKIHQLTDDQVPTSRKRVASPVSVSSDNELHKRLKTSDEDNDAVAVIEPTSS